MSFNKCFPVLVFSLLLVISIFGFFPKETKAADMVSPTVDITYSKNPVGLGTNTITATYSEPITSKPTISINQQGTSDISNGTMVKVGGQNWKMEPVSEIYTPTSIIWGNNIFVLATSDGNIFTSPDGITWTARIASEANVWKSVAYGNGLFVAVSSLGTNRVMTSPDGINWTSRIAAQANKWVSITYGNGLFVAVSSDGINRVMTSPDGDIWTVRATAVSATWKSLAYGNGLFVVLSTSSTSMTSPNGIDWTGSSIFIGSSISITYGNGLFVVISNSSIVTSSNGTTWIDRVPAITSSPNWSSVTYGDGLFVAVNGAGSNNLTNQIMTSPDGITWTARTVIGSDCSWKSVTYGNGAFISVGTNCIYNTMKSFSSVFSYDYTVNQNNGTTYKDGIATVSLLSTTDLAGNPSLIPINNTFSIDTTGPTASLSYSKDISGPGINTISASYSEPVLGVPNISIDQLGTSNIVNQPTIAPASIWTARTAVQTNNWATSVTYGNGLFVAASGNGSANGSNIMTSTDGITWTAQMSSNLNIWANSVTYGKGLFIAVAGNGDNQVMTSPDGIIWTAQMASSANNWASVTYGNGLFVAIANNGDNQVMTSPDGITWIDRMVSNANSWASVTYGNGLFVTVGTGVMTSHDGINWKSETITPNNNGWGSIVYGNGLFVAVAKTADINNVMTSPDGTNWTLQNLPEINTWYSVTYGNGLFVAVAGGFGTNQIMTSPDGINWTILLEPISDDWTSVSYGNNTFVALSSLGSVMTSPDYGGNYIYDYTVNQADGTNYIDGEAVVSLSPVTDVLGNPSQAPTNTTFTIDTVSPSIPVASPTSGTYTGTQSITLTSVGSDSFRYSTTEAPANCSADTLYASPIEISSTSTLYAIACDNAGNSSSSTFDYVINTPVVIASSSNHSSGGSTLEFRNKFIAEQKALLEAQTNTTVTPPTTPVVSGTLFITKTLKLKVTSNEVKELQKYLNTNGYVLASLGAGSLGKETTYFGPATKKAVIAFQKANKLAADGIVGKMTASLMK